MSLISPNFNVDHFFPILATGLLPKLLEKALNTNREYKVSGLPGKASGTHVNLSADPSHSTCILEAGPDKLDIKKIRT